jgi:hypothetical protein
MLSNNKSATGELASVAQGLGVTTIRDLKSVSVRLGKYKAHCYGRPVVLLGGSHFAS